MEKMEDTKGLENSDLNLDLIDNKFGQDVLKKGMVSSLNSNPCQINENRFQILLREDMDDGFLFVNSEKTAVVGIRDEDGVNVRKGALLSKGILDNSANDGSRSRGEKATSGNGDVAKSKLAKEIRSLGPISANTRGRIGDGGSRKKVGGSSPKKG
ncbi:hypothetical protein MA16_Dca000923 [Dendrobium catenatum]|uniref:Uncharacterized protein n=1 Tax=Dendrobium catenatum TaxID=906689 RepID=A0A2I0WV89_9ASPA|nr:hypothetical protein MA16_Dca000923 [Dendrobium catenatum]